MTLASFPALQASAAALLSLVVFLILTGRLVPRRNLEDMREDRDVWKKAWETSEKSRQLEASHTGQLLEGVRTSAKVLENLPVPTNEAGKDVSAPA